MKRLSLRPRLLFVGLVPALVVASLLTLNAIRTDLAEIERTTESRGRLMAEQLAPASLYGVFSGNPAILLDLARSVAEAEDVAWVRIRSARGEVLAEAWGGASDAATPRVFTAPIHGPRIALDETATIASEPANTEPLGRTEVALSPERARNERLASMRGNLALTLAGLGFAVLLAIGTARRIARPVEDMARAVERIRAGRLDTRLAVQEGDEIGTLGRGVNAMAERIEQAHARLEAEVRQATHDLAETLEEMEIRNVEMDLARRHALEASRTRTAFLANVSHELRTPLNGIVGFSELLARGERTPERREQAELLRRSAHHLLELIDELLDFTRIEAGSLTFANEPFALRECIEEAVAIVLPAAREQRLELALVVYLDVPARVDGDCERLRQVLLNLLGNAVKFTPHGHVTVRVMLENETADEVTLRIAVEDTGIGMSPEFLTHVFEPFTQEGNSLRRRHGGTGLGLAISRRLVDRMGGTIDVESRPGQGTTFTFTVRLGLAASETSASSPLAGLRCLLCDSNPVTRLALRSQLTALHVEVVECECPGYAGLGQACDGHFFDFLCVGASADELETPELGAMLATRPARPPLLLLGNVDESELPERAGLPPRQCLARPPRLARLAERIASLLERGQQDRAPDDEILPLLSGSRVLIADDNAINRALAIALLEQAGATCVAVGDGAACVERASSERFEAILMDLRMPELDGIEATRRIRATEPPGQHVRIVGVTASILPGVREAALQAGMDECLLKPWRPTRLIQTLTAQRDAASPETMSATPAAHEVVHDRAGALERAGGDAALAARLLATLRSGLPDALRGLQRAIERRDTTEAIALAHHLRGGALTCGARELAETAAQLERLAHAGQEHALPEAARLLERAVRRFLDVSG